MFMHNLIQNRKVMQMVGSTVDIQMSCRVYLSPYLKIAGTQPSVQSLSRVWLFATPWTAACQASLSFTISQSLLKLTHVHWVSDAIQPSHPVIPFSSCLQSFPASRSLQMSQLFESGGQSIGASASASVLPMNTQGWFSLGLMRLISLLSKGLSRVFPSTTFQKHPFFGAQHFLWTNSHIHTWLLEKP